MRKEKMMEAYLDSYEQICVYIHEKFYQGRSDTFRLVLDATGEACDLKITGITQSSDSYSKYFLAVPGEGIEIGQEYSILADYALRCPLEYGYVVRSARFDEQFAYDGDDLGPVFHPDGLDLALWAPTACEVKVNLTDPRGRTETIPLTRTDKGVYRVHLVGNYDRYAYTYLVHVNGVWNEAVDPYAWSADANKKHGYIIDPGRLYADLGKIDQPVIRANTDAVIYETSVRDFTWQWQQPWSGKFTGFIQSGLQTPSGQPAGLDHLKELGITHVEIMPAMDFTSVDEEHVSRYYNWGYDPGHYMIPEGSYSLNPNDPYSRVRELQEMVRGLHAAGLRVIFDVVYNHMRERTNSDYEQIVPNYYFRLSESGAPSNGSFCGNDFDSTRQMSRKAILDSVKHWTKWYGADGFRFDLMGILDIQTMNEIERWIHSVRPDAVLLGEGWNMPTLLPEDQKADMANSGKMPRIGHFNDFFRDQVKGSSDEHNLGSRGFATGDLRFIGSMPTILTGCDIHIPGQVQIFDSPEKTVNYVECHDGATVWDKMRMSNADEDHATKVQRQKFMLGFVLLSQGVPFIHSGQEFCRTKRGVTNSYASSDEINEIHWERLDKYRDVSDYCRQLIHFRRQHASLRLKDAEMIARHADVQIAGNELILYTLKDLEEIEPGLRTMILLFNGTLSAQEYRFPSVYRVLFEKNGIAGEQWTDTALVDPLTITVLGEEYV